MTKRADPYDRRVAQLCALLGATVVRPDPTPRPSQRSIARPLMVPTDPETHR